MSTTATSGSSALSAAATAAQTIAAAQAAEQAAAQSIISGSTGSSVDVSALVTSIVGAKTAGATATLSAAATTDTNTLSAYGTLQAALEAFQTGVTALANGSALGSFTTNASGSGLTATTGTGATAGSYQIAVTQVASQQALTSAAFSPTAALGTGTMTVSVGGSSMSIAVTSANNTLSGIANAIMNSSSNPGITATVVTGTNGAHLVLTSSNPGAANTINVAVSGVANDNGLSSLGVTSAQGTNSLSLPSVSSATATLGSGSMNISVGGSSMSIAVASTETLSDVAAAINSSSSIPGLTASIVTGTGGTQQLVLKSTNTGTANAINVSVTGDSNTGDTLNSLGVVANQVSSISTTGASTITSGSAANPWNQTTPAEDTQYTIDGTAGTSSTDVITAIQGVTINATSAAIGTPAGTPQTLTVAQNTSGASSAITGFVALYNTLVTTYGQVAGFDSTQAAGSQGGPLLGNSTLNTIQNSLANIISSGVKNGNSTISLASIGITMNQDGTLTANTTATNTTTTIADALSTNLSGVAALFNTTTGIGAQLNNALTTFLDPNNGQLANSVTAVKADQASIATQQGALATYTAQLTNQYQAEFTALNSLMATTNNNSQYLTQLFGGANSAGAMASATNT
jgi:flagellar hook-associated protein 2